MRRSIELGNKVELVTEVTLDNKQDVYNSKIQEIKEDGTVVILAPIEAGRIIPLDLNHKYGMCVYTPKGLYRCEVRVIKRTKSEKLYLISLEIMTSLQKYQRRQFYRMNCMLTFQYKDDETDTWNEGIILDISGGGMRFTSNSGLELKKTLITHLKLNLGDVEEEELFLSASIIGSDKTKLDQTVYENRVEFDHIDNYEREVIIKFIFEEERKRRKRRKGM